MKCKRHPSRETELRCSSCEDPICPACGVLTPVGYKCPSCARPARTTSSVTPLLLIRSVSATLAASLIGGLVVVSIPLLILASMAYGWLIGQVAYVSSGRRTGWVVESIGAGCAVIGLLVARGVQTGARSVVGLHLDIWILLAIVLAASLAVSRIRNG